MFQPSSVSTILVLIWRIFCNDTDCQSTYSYAGDFDYAGDSIYPLVLLQANVCFFAFDRTKYFLLLIKLSVILKLLRFLRTVYENKNVSLLKRLAL